MAWARWGAWYEANGDYSGAASAYGRAFAEKPDPDMAFAAGQAAENAGDVSQAVLYYTQLLKRPSDRKPLPEKGTSLWNPEHDTV